MQLVMVENELMLLRMIFVMPNTCLRPAVEDLTISLALFHSDIIEWTEPNGRDLKYWLLLFLD